MADESSFDRFWPRRRRRPGPHRVAGRSMTRRRTALFAERLEDRRLLAANPNDGFDQRLSDGGVLPAVTPAWFASLVDDPVSHAAGAAGTSSILATRASRPTTRLRGNGPIAQVPSVAAKSVGPAEDAASGCEWIVRLSSRALETVRSVPEAAAYLQQAAVMNLEPAALGLQVVEGLGLPGQLLVRATAPAGTVEQYFAANVGIASFSRNGTTQVSTIPNDPSFTKLFGLNNVGQTGGTTDADIDAPEAWNVTTGSRSTVVAVIDTGIDYTHPDLAANVWTNPGEIAGNGVDDDRNGFVDDVHGYDFVNNDGDPMDDHYHGTHVSGTIGAVGNNGTGVAGVSWNVSLMALKFLDASGSGSTADAIRAINYATMMRTTYGVDVRVTNNSWGGGGYEAGLLDAIDAGGAAGILFVAAAGNSGTNTDESPSYPAAHDSPAIVSVAATDSRDSLAWFSNYGTTSVDLAAPGVNIYSTMPGNRYGSVSGTSMATPHVAGVAALALAADPSLSVAQLKSRLIDNVDPVASLLGKTASGGRLNAANVVNAITAHGPTIAIASSESSLKRGGTATITFSLGSPSTDFTASDVTVAGGTLSGFAGSGDLYTATFTPTSGIDGFGTITVASGTFTDGSGRPNSRGALATAIRIVTNSLEVVGTPLSLGFSPDGSLVGPTIGAKWNGIEFLRYGTFLANWTVAIGGTNYSNVAAAGLTSFPVTLDDASAGDSHEVRITGSPRSGVSVVRTVTWRDGDDHALVTTTITNGTAAPVSGVALLENDDPDPDGRLETSNDVLRTGRLVVASAAGGAMGLGSADPRAVASAEGFFVNRPAEILLSPVDPNGAVDDSAINLAFTIGTLAPGASDTSSFAMIFGIDQAAVVDRFDKIVAAAPPTVVIAASSSAVRAADSATITFTLSKPSTTFTASAVTVRGGTLSNFDGSGADYTATFTPLADYSGPAAIAVTAGSFTDGNGTANVAGSLTAPLAVDARLPSIVIATSKTALRAGTTAAITFRLSEPSRDFTTTDLVVTGGTLSALAGSGVSYTATFTPTVGFNGIGAIAVAAGSFTDAAGNPNTAGALTPSIRIDIVAPTIAVTADKTALKAGETSVLTFTLSEMPVSFTGSMVTVAGGTLSNFTGSGTTYTAKFTPAANFTGVGTVAVTSRRFVDAAGNANLAGSLSPTLAIDTKPPAVAIATSLARLKTGDTALLTFTLGESASDFTIEDVAVTGGTLSDFSGSGTTYTATFTPTRGFAGTGAVTVMAGTFTDAAGNGNTRGVLWPSLSIDTRPPTVGITSSLTTIKAGATSVVTFRLSESSRDFTAADVAVTGGTLSNFTGSGMTYTATFTPAAGNVGAGTVTIDAGAFTDAAGNANIAGTLAAPLRIDMVVPTIVITAAKTALKAGETTVITFTLSESPKSFTASMVTVTGGALSSFAGSGMVYTAKFTPIANLTGVGTVTVNAGKFFDAAGNANLAGSLSPALAIDTKPPAVAITTSLARLKTGDTALLTFTLGESATDFTADDVAVTGGTLSNFTGSGTSYTATFTPTPGFAGTGTVTVVAGKFRDAAGNANIAATLAGGLAIAR